MITVTDSYQNSSRCSLDNNSLQVHSADQQARVLAHLEFGHPVCRGVRQIIDQHHIARHLDGAQAFTAPLRNVFGLHGHAGALDDCYQNILFAEV